MTGQPEDRAVRRPTGRHAHLSGAEVNSYLDGVLPARRASRVMEHLSACERCDREVAALRAAKTAVAGLGEAEPEVAWLPRVTTLLCAEAVPAPRLSYRSQHALRRRAAIVGGITVAAGLGIWLTPPPPAPVSFRQEVRHHLVLMDEPTADQASYVVEARNP